MKILSLRWRLTSLLAWATLIALGAAAWVVDWRADSEMKQRFDSALLVRAQALAAMVEIENGKAGVDAELFKPGFLSSQASWYDLRCNGTSVARSRDMPPPAASSREPRFADARLADGRILREVSFRFAPPGASASDAADARAAGDGSGCNLRYAQDRGPLDEILDTLDWILLGSLFGACALVLLLTPLLVRRGLQPLSALAGAMADIGPNAPGHLSQLFPRHAADSRDRPERRPMCPP